MNEHVAQSGVERLPMWEMYGGFWALTRWIIYGLAVVVMAIFAYGIWQRVRAYRMGRKAEGALDNIGQRIGDLVRYGIAQMRVIRETYPGVFHLLMFWGFAVLFFGTAITVLDEDFYRLVVGEKFLVNGTYIGLSFLLDVFGLLAIIGLLMALYRRYVTKPERLDNKQEDASLLVLILLILVTGFLTEGARIGVVAGSKTGFEYEAASFVGYGLAKAFGNSPGLHKFFWSLHVLISFAFIATLPYTKGLHIFSTLANIFTRTHGPKAKTPTIPRMMERMEAGEEIEMGIKRIDQMTWREILQTDACTRCGRCQAQCPAHNTGKHLSPKTFIQDVKEHWLAEWAKKRDANLQAQPAPAEGAAPAEDAGPFLLEAEAACRACEGGTGKIKSQVLWDCTNCMACVNICPVFVEHVPLINQMRRELAMEFDDSEKACKDFFKKMDTNANPWGMNPSDRMSWTAEVGAPSVLEKPDYEYLYWVGCMGGYDPRAIKIGKAFVKILQAANVNFAVLGELEMCCGDSLRRLGNEASFQALVTMFKENIKGCKMDPTFAGKKVLVTCPHGFNTLKHEYPEFGFQWQVIHHTEFIYDLIKQGKLKLRGGNGHTAVLHDSCFLARYNDIIDQPREILKSCGLKMVEVERSRDLTFCCGGGGGRAWLEEHYEPEKGINRINFDRTDELLKAGADNIVAACPLCMMMFDEATKRNECEALMVNKRLLDIAEIVAERLEEPKAN